MQIRGQSGTQVGLNLRWLDNPSAGCLCHDNRQGCCQLVLWKVPLEVASPGPHRCLLTVSISAPECWLRCGLHLITITLNKVPQEAWRRQRVLSPLPVGSYYLLSHSPWESPLSWDQRYLQSLCQWPQASQQPQHSAPRTVSIAVWWVYRNLSFLRISNNSISHFSNTPVRCLSNFSDKEML